MHAHARTHARAHAQARAYTQISPLTRQVAFDDFVAGITTVGSGDSVEPSAHGSDAHGSGAQSNKPTKHSTGVRS